MPSVYSASKRIVIIQWILGIASIPTAGLLGWATSSVAMGLLTLMTAAALQQSLVWFKTRAKIRQLESHSAQQRSALALNQAAIDGAQVAMMFVDRNFIVTRINKKTEQLFRTHESDFRKVWPTFDANNMIGQCIDMFHKNPRYQRDMLADPSKLPHVADIRVGDLAFNLQVSAQIDPQGNYVGNLLEWADVTKQRQLEALDAAMNRSQLIVEYNTEGIILNANENFLNTMGYSLTDIVGQHRRFLTDRTSSQKEDDRRFWANLKGGQQCAGEYKLLCNDGREVWLQSAYNPIKDQRGNTIKVVSLSTDITETKNRNSDLQGKLAAIGKSQCVAEFGLDGTILDANENFLHTFGFSLSDIKGRHHRLLVDPAFSSSHEYLQFWDKLRNGDNQSGEYKRVASGGKILWLRASYNPILDPNGKPYKVVKYSTDITVAKELEFAIAERQQADEDAAKQLRLNVNEILTVAEKAARRDYSQKLTIQSQDEIGNLAAGLSKFFEEKQASEQAEHERIERERASATEVAHKVSAVLEVVRAMAAGDFSVAIPNLGEDAVGQVGSALSDALTSIRTALQSVQSVADTVSSAASQLTGAAREISNGAQTQASSLEETASSLEEITSTVKQNSDNAQQARQLANGSRDVAERGGTVVSEAVQAMEEINRASKKIADIITAIDEIAFQTNLLALNAAVEAARAGEQGRGFAVVAAEVRNLAQRSASAAKEIKNLIQDSVAKVETGTELVNRSGQSLTDIVNSVKRVTDIVAEIAAASKEQLSGIEQVNKAVSQMDQVTQGNAAQTEEMSSTANLLLSHAQELSNLVGHFKLTDEGDKPSHRKTEKSKRPAARDNARTNETSQPTLVLDLNSTTDARVLEF